MTDLADRLEAATEGSRKLSNEVLLVAGWKAGWHPRVLDDEPVSVWSPADPVSFWIAPEGSKMPDGAQPDPTRDLNAIAALIRGAGYVYRLTGYHGFHEGVIWRYVNSFREGAQCLGAAAPTLALCAAFVKASAAPAPQDP